MSPKPSRAFTGIPSINEVRAHARKNLFILTVILLGALIFCTVFSPEVITPDGSTYMLLGKQMTQGRYPETFFHRMPMLPFLFAALYVTGLPVSLIGMVIPLAFMMLSLVSTYLLARELAGEDSARIATLLLFSFPDFWRWGLKFLTDIPLLAISAFSVYYFMKALKDGRYFIHAGIFIAIGMLTKLSFFLVPAIFLLYVIAARRDCLRSARFWQGLIIPAIVFSSVFAAISSLRAADDFTQFGTSAQIITSEEGMTPFMQLLTGNYGDIESFLRLVLFPVIVFSPFGVVSLWKRKLRFPVHFSLLFLLALFVMSSVRLRYYSPLFPFIAIFSAEGLSYLKHRKVILGSRKLAGLVMPAFLALLAASFINAMYIVSLDFGMDWGIVTLSDYVRTLNGTIASEYMPHYLNMTNDVIIGNEWYRSVYGENFSYGAVSGMGADYMVVSIYGEYARSPSNETYHPYFGPFEVSFVSRPYTAERIPPDFTFRSELFRKLESDANFDKVREIHGPSGQLLFIIYGVRTPGTP